MFQVVVIPNNTTSNLSLCYKTEDKAKAAHQVFKDKIFSPEKSHIDVADDFGNVLSILPDNIAYTMLIDVAKSQWREWEQMQCVERTRSLLNKRAPILAA